MAGYGNVKRAKVGAIAVSPNGHIIATAHNRRVRGIPGKYTEHAEEVLLHKLDRIKAWDRFGEIHILVIRVNSTGITIAKPCYKCQILLSSYPVKVFYADRDGSIKKLAQ